MRYTSRRIAGFLCIVLSIIIIARLIPAWLYIMAIMLIIAGIIYMLYNYIYG